MAFLMPPRWFENDVQRQLAADFVGTPRVATVDAAVPSRADPRAKRHVDSA